jgi:hypothetical protein
MPTPPSNPLHSPLPPQLFNTTIPARSSLTLILIHLILELVVELGRELGQELVEVVQVAETRILEVVVERAFCRGIRTRGCRIRSNLLRMARLWGSDS